MGHQSSCQSDALLLHNSRLLFLNTRVAIPRVKRNIWTANNMGVQSIVRLKKRSNKSVFLPEEPQMVNKRGYIGLDMIERVRILEFYKIISNYRVMYSVQPQILLRYIECVKTRCVATAVSAVSMMRGSQATGTSTRVSKKL
ncbi:hypothetical protein TNCV_191241 [Trichonephila clavipes]|nr:hypothetical protein TNCV_191241 [Trichonephila clavipes]